MAHREPVRVRREMGVSHAEFFRILPRFAGDLEPVVTDRRVVLSDGGRTAELILSDERERTLSPVVRLPYTVVEIVLTGYGEAERKALMQRFDQCFQKGGG